MKKVISILLIGLFAVSLLFAQEKAPKAHAKAKKMESCKEGMGKSSGECKEMKSGPKAKKMECCKEGMEECSGKCKEMKSEAKGKKMECCKEGMEKSSGESKKDAQKEAPPKEVTPKPEGM
jgi:hypothetical protein